MTDEQVIKAFECCSKIEEGSKLERCFECPMFEEDVDDCTARLFRKGLYLIKRQRSEIERWKSEAIAYYDLWCKGMADVQTAKSEAYKEFADRLKNKIRDMRFLTEAEYQCEEIDNLVKELTEGSK